MLVMRHVEQVIAAERYEELRKGWELADECTRLAADGHSLAEVLGRVADAINARVAVIDQNAFELVSAGSAHGGTARTALRLPSGAVASSSGLPSRGSGATSCCSPSWVPWLPSSPCS